MKKFLFTTLPSNDLGLLTRSLPIASELRNRGNQIAFCSPAKAPIKLISEAGFDNLLPTQPLDYIISGDISFKSLTRLLCSKNSKRNIGMLISGIRHISKSGSAEIWDIDHFMSLTWMWNETFIRSSVNAMIETIYRYEPDGIVDFWNPVACIAARAANKPLITVIQADLHPRSKGFIWWKPVPSRIYPSAVPATNAILEEFHLPTIQKMGELFISDLTLVLGIPETDPLPENANVTYIGPILWQRQNNELPQWIANLNSKQPVIWLYPGNLQYMKGSRTPYDSEVVLKACIEALGNEAVQVVLTTGHHILPRRFIPLPPNFYHAPFLPGLAMAERSDLLIHHGGYSSCQMGLYTGTPALVVPTYSERESNARRIAEQGAGDYLLPDIAGRKKHVSADEVRNKVFNILSEDNYIKNAKRISSKMKTFGGAAEAARLIDELV
jgi:UDP:flavonoid glycosyltransferase YjiC (YdhE family)